MAWVNFLPWRRQRIIRQQRLYMRVLAALVLSGLCLLAALHFRLSAENQRWQQRLLQQQTAIADADERASQLAQLQQAYQGLLLRLTNRQRRQQINQQWLGFALALPQLVPEQLWLTRISKTAAGVTVHGVGHQLADIHALRLRLEEQSLFHQVSQGPVERQPDGDMQFSLLASLRTEAESE